MNRIIVVVISLLFLQVVDAAQYRLKFSATVDVLEGGTVTGQKRLKAGTIFELAETASSDTSSASDTKSAKQAKKAALVASDMSPAVWKNKRPPHNVFRAEIEFGNSYYRSWSGKQTTHWCVSIHARNKDWEYTNESWLCGYVQKTSPVGKRIEAALSDGKGHRALVQVKPTKFKDEEDMCIIEDFEIVSGE